MGRELILEKNKPYHIVVRAVEKRTIFLSEEERMRFMVQMYIANVGEPSVHLTRKGVKSANTAILQGEEVPRGIVEQQHDPLVHFFSFALVGNHYHFGLIGNFDNAISKYLHKLNTSFAKFFNFKHHRTGSLFERGIKVVSLTSERQIAVLLRYINIKNVLDVYQPRWQEKGLGNVKEAVQFLKTYPYSSFPDLYLERSSHLIPKTNHEVLKKVLGDGFSPYGTSIKEEVGDFLYSKGIEEYRDLFLESE